MVLQDIEFLISYGYRHTIDEAILHKFARRAVNLHLSYLPWNRGADPVLWSWLEDTPKGVSIHYIDVGSESGRLLAQREIEFEEDETLGGSEEKLAAAVEELFREIWPRIRDHRQQSFTQPPGGTHHTPRDRAAIEHLLIRGKDTPVRDLIGKATTAKV
jgi:methionyl-tRNA formyltransferase